MAQIVVRNIEEDVMQGLKAMAARDGVSAEQAVRSLIADAVDAIRRRDAFRKAAASGRARLLDTHGAMSDSTTTIRSDRDP